MNNEKFIELAKKQFTNVYVSGDDVELEKWTHGGVDMIISLVLEIEETLLEQFQERVESFDVDEEIDYHRQDERYKSDFTIRQSLEDFESFKEWLDEVLENIECEINKK